MPRGGPEHGYTEQDHPPAIPPPRPRQRPPPFLRAGRSPFRFLAHLRQAGCGVAKRRRNKMRKPKQRRPAASLPADLLAEMVLPRVPYRSLCRFRCVSRSWRALCSDRRVLSRSPQALSGFFCHSRDARCRGFICYSREGHLLGFRNLSGGGRPLIDPSLPFLRERGYRSVTLIHCCNGILLCSDRRPSPTEYIVCNPATEEIWAVLPVPASHGPPRDNNICLCFDPAVPSYFAVFVKPSDSDGVEVYSSETGLWASLLSDSSPSFDDGLLYVFFNGSLHLSGFGDSSIVTLDTKGETWGTIPMSDDTEGAFIEHSQGRLHAMRMVHDGTWQLSVWVLEDYASGQWTLKHTVDHRDVLAGCNPSRMQFGFLHWRGGKVMVACVV